MAAYAAFVSVVHLMDQVQLYHARHNIFDEHQLNQLESLGQKVSFLQDFLETYFFGDGNESVILERRVVAAAYAVEDVVESYIVDHIHLRLCTFKKKKKMKKKMESPYTMLSKFYDAHEYFFVRQSNESTDLESQVVGTASAVEDVVESYDAVESCDVGDILVRISTFSQDVTRVTQGIDLIKSELLECQNRINSPHLKQPHQQPASVRPAANSDNDTVVGFDEISVSVMDKLTLWQSSIQFIAVIGMGGSGKSTLAKKAYDSMIKRQHFDRCSWVTISQQPDVNQVLLGLLRETGCTIENEKETDFHRLGEQLHKHLFGRRFFIVLDDIWSVDVWNKIKMYLPDNKDRSRVLITTRISNLASDIGCFHTFKMNFLDENDSWSLLCSKVFGKETCPPELVEVGKAIAKNCKGLPLSIVVIGGLLRKSVTQEYWEYIKADTSASVNSEEHCLNILRMSYVHLPVYLRPCFMYFGMFPEDDEISVSKLIKLWIAERFLKKNKTKSLEELGMDYLKELINRNLVIVSKLGCTGNLKQCKVHDLLRDLCLREAKKQQFLHFSEVIQPDISNGLTFSPRRLAISRPTHEKHSFPRVHDQIMLPLFLRSFASDYKLNSLPAAEIKLLRILRVLGACSEDLFMDCGKFTYLVNLQYLDVSDINPVFPSFLYPIMWNLQTLAASESDLSISSEFWEMSQLRHVIGFSLTLDDPCSEVVLENLHTLELVTDFSFSEEVIRKIPNLKKLKVSYTGVNKFSPDYLRNIGHLTKLESLEYLFDETIEDVGFSVWEFSASLKKLTLRQVYGLDWNEMGEKIGSLPHLEKFELANCYGESEWNSLDGQFPRLKYLKLHCSYTLVRWTVETTSFPCLEELVLYFMDYLEGIPSEIGDLSTLRSIRVFECNPSVVNSAKMIEEDQISLGNDDLLVDIRSFRDPGS